MWLLSLLITALGDYRVVLATERERKGEEWDGGEGKISVVICI